AVAVEHQPLHVRVLRAQWRDEHERDPALLQDVPGLVLHLGFEPGIRDHVESESVAVEERALPGVPDEKPHMVDLAKGDIGEAHGKHRCPSPSGWMEMGWGATRGVAPGLCSSSPSG